MFVEGSVSIRGWCGVVDGVDVGVGIGDGDGRVKLLKISKDQPRFATNHIWEAIITCWISWSCWISICNCWTSEWRWGGDYYSLGDSGRWKQGITIGLIIQLLTEIFTKTRGSLLRWGVRMYRDHHWITIPMEWILFANHDCSWLLNRQVINLSAQSFYMGC